MKTPTRGGMIALLLLLAATFIPAVAGIPALAQAQQPQYPIHDEETFKANVKSYHKIPFNDPDLEFDILLPKDWSVEALSQKDSTPDLSRKILDDIARFRSPFIGVSQAMVVVRSIHLDREISAQNWMKSYILTSGYTLQDSVTAIDNKKANAYYISASEGKSIYGYASVQISKNIAMLVQFEMPLGLKEPLSFLQKRVVDSFRKILVTDDPVEEQKNFIVADALKITYPQSWTIRYPDLKNPANLSVQIHNETAAKRIEGMIRFQAIKRDSKTSLKQEIEKLRQYCNNFLKIDFKQMVSSDKAQVSQRFIFSRYEVYQAAAKKSASSDQEFRLAALGDKEWYIFVYMLSPSEAVNPSAWSYNTQSFDLILKNLK